MIGRPARPPFDADPDPRVGRLMRMARGSARGATPAADPLRAHVGESFSRSIHFGIVIQALPHLGWHRVQVDGGYGTVGAFGPGRATAIGPQSVDLYPPGTPVLLVRYPGFDEWAIVACVPEATRGIVGTDRNGLWPVSVSRFGVDAGSATVARLLDGGGTARAGRGLPADGTVFDAGTIDPDTGVGLVHDSFSAFLLGGRGCGVGVSRPDQLVRTFGRHMQSWSDGQTVETGDDEGEGYAEVRDYPYPGEAARRVTYGGYNGQGQTVVTALEDGRAVGLDHTGLDGTRVIASATRILLAKRPGPFPAPRRGVSIFSPDGDDAATGEYKAAGRYGTGPDHLVGDPRPGTASDDLVAFLHQADADRAGAGVKRRHRAPLRSARSRSAAASASWRSASAFIAHQTSRTSVDTSPPVIAPPPRRPRRRRASAGSPPRSRSPAPAPPRAPAPR